MEEPPEFVSKALAALIKSETSKLFALTESTIGSFQFGFLSPWEINPLKNDLALSSWDEQYKIEGKYSFNERGYLVCEFGDLFLNYTGMTTDKNEGIIPFHVYDSRLKRQWSEVFQID